MLTQSLGDLEVWGELEVGPLVYDTPERRAHYNNLGSIFNEFLNGDQDQRSKLILSLEQQSRRQGIEAHPRIPALAGLACLQMAHDETSGSIRFNWLSRSAWNIETSQQLQAHGDRQLDIHTARAATVKPELDLHHKFLKTGKLPSIEANIKAYAQLLSVSSWLQEEYHAFIRRLKAGDGAAAQQVGEMTGLMAELDVALLLKRDEILNNGPDSRSMTVRSLLVQDSVGDQASDLPAWDINTYTQLGSGTAELTYRAQIKARGRKRTDPSDQSEVTNVFLATDLVVSDDPELVTEAHVPPTKIIKECIEDARGSEKAARVLDYRTRQLFDILG